MSSTVPTNECAFPRHRHNFADVETGSALPRTSGSELLQQLGVVLVEVMAEDHALPLRVSEIKDPAVLFERYNTEEIRRIERKVRGEIEQKKEELRQMVGERYRDLIDAADTIGEMRQCSESVVQSIQDMHQYCLRLKQSKSIVANNKQDVKVLICHCIYGRVEVRPLPLS